MILVEKLTGYLVTLKSTLRYKRSLQAMLALRDPDNSKL